MIIQKSIYFCSPINSNDNLYNSASLQPLITLLHYINENDLKNSS